jgi:hypothetical protein
MTNSQFVHIFGKSQNASSKFLDTTNFGSSLNCAMKSHEQKPIQPSSNLGFDRNTTTMLIRPM